MAELCEDEFDQLRIDKKDFVPGTLEEELRVDALCKDLLLKFYRETLAAGISDEEATLLAQGADYFVRDFVVSIKQMSIFAEQTDLVRQFAGNWYIIVTMEPNIPELVNYLEGIKAFYRFLHGHRLISTRFLQDAEHECSNIPYYEGRIESFWTITGDGYVEWERECTLKADK